MSDHLSCQDTCRLPLYGPIHDIILLFHYRIVPRQCPRHSLFANRYGPRHESGSVCNPERQEYGGIPPMVIEVKCLFVCHTSQIRRTGSTVSITSTLNLGSLGPGLTGPTSLLVCLRWLLDWTIPTSSMSIGECVQVCLCPFVWVQISLCVVKDRYCSRVF